MQFSAEQLEIVGFGRDDHLQSPGTGSALRHILEIKRDNRLAVNRQINVHVGCQQLQAYAGLVGYDQRPESERMGANRGDDDTIDCICCIVVLRIL